MNKRMKCGFVELVMLCLCSGLVQAAVSGDFEYTDHGTYIELTDYTGASSDLSIPETINGKPVTKLGTSLFRDNTSLTNIFVPFNIQSIETSSFYRCRNLISIGVAGENSSYCSVGGALFNKSRTIIIHYPENKAGSTYEVPAGVTTIGDYAFYSCNNLIRAILPDSLTHIGFRGFQLCASLSEINFPPNLESIDNVAFASTDLEDVIIPASVSFIHDNAFTSCEEIRSYTVAEENLVYSSDNGILYNKDKTSLLRVPPRSYSGSFIIPEGVTRIEVKAFEYCSALTSVTVPEGVTSIRWLAFRQCTGMERIYFLGNASSVANDAFKYLPSSEFSFYFLEGNTGFTTPTWENNPCEAVAAILPPGIPNGTEYEDWVLKNFGAWGTSDFSAIPAEDFEKSWLVDTMPVANMDSVADFHVEVFNISSNKVSLTLGLNLDDQPKAGAVNGWLAINGRESMTTNGWKTVGGQSADQDKLSFSNGQATIIFDCPSGVCFFMPTLQKSLPSDGVTIEAQ